jgi:hypothetical protein
MNTKLNSCKNAASALLITLFLITILAVSIGGYMAYVQQQSLLGARGQTWNLALAVSEAGVEEGLQHLNANYDYLDFNHLDQDGWSRSGSTYSLSRTLPDGSSYDVTIDIGSDPAHPLITSHGFVTPPFAARSIPTSFFAAATVPAQVGRGVRVKAAKKSFFDPDSSGNKTKDGVDMNGKNVWTSSYSSCDPAKSTNGRYDPTKAGDKGDVSANEGMVDVGNAKIYGHVHVSPGGNVAVGSQGAIGSHAWVDAGNTGIQPGWVIDNANFTFPEITLPFSSGLPPDGGTVITIDAASTNSTVYDHTTSLPPSLSGNQVLGPITTNTSTASSTTYPNPVPAGLTTNSSLVDVFSYPGPQPGLITNCIGFTTSGTSPGNAMCLSTNSLGTTNTSAYPGTVAGLVTNITVVTTGTNVSVVTNITCTGATTTTASYPGVRPCTITTNTALVQNASAFPAAGTYVGNVTTNGGNQGSGKGSGNAATTYSYTSITGYTTTANPYSYTTNTIYTYTTNRTYSYPVYTYDYGNQFKYTYTQYTYTYPSYTYNYTIYSEAYTYHTNTYDHIIRDGDYTYTGDLSGTTAVVGDARLVLPNGLNMGGNDYITVVSGQSIVGGTTYNGGHLQTWVGGTSLTVSGNGSINQSGYAGDFVVYALPSVTTVRFNGNGTFTGVLIAPTAAGSLNGGGHDQASGVPDDFYGMLVLKSETLNGHFRFIYDECLEHDGHFGNSGRYIVQSWEEIP